MNFVYLVIFILLALAILFGAHFLLYFATVNIFLISNPAFQHILFLALAFLAVSFLVSSLLAHWNENIFTRSYYFLSGFWLGILVNLIMAVTAASVIFGIAQLFGLNIHLSMLGGICFILAFVYSLYGSWNTYHPKIKKITVKIPNLPALWKGKKIVQISDLHLGHIFQAGFLAKVVEKINSVKPAMVVITGDLFDGMDGHLENHVKPLRNIRSKNGVYYVTGNHETYLGVDKVLSILKKTKVKVLKDQVADIGGLKLIGIDYPSQGEIKDITGIIKSLRKDYSGKPNILLYHSPAFVEEFKKSGVNLQLSGHTHCGQIFPFGFIAKIVYGKYYYGLHKSRGYTLYTTSGTGTWGPTMRTGSTPEIVSIKLE